MELTEKVSRLEDEIKVLKNEVQAVLLDLRESCLNFENPFNAQMSMVGGQPIAVNLQTSMSEPGRKDAPNKANNKPNNKIESVEETKIAVDEPEPVTAHEEVTRAEGLRIETGIKSVGHLPGRSTKVDITTIAALTGWVSESAKNLGRARTEAVLDMSEIMGYLSRDLKAVLLKLVYLAPEGHCEDVPTREYLNALLKLASLLDADNKSEVALLSILSEEDRHR
jgi:hypothetical protein